MIQITVEISFYPLQAHFGSFILDFIRELKKEPSLRVKTNNLSTQISGPFDLVMHRLTETLKLGFSQEFRAAAVIKMYNEAVELEWLDLEI